MNAAAPAVRTLARSRALTAPVLARAYATPPNANDHKVELDPQLNGYPQLPNVSRQHLPPYGWWDQQMRRNFGDTLHENEELHSMWGPDISVVPRRTALAQFTLATLAFVGFGFLINAALIPDRPAVAREYPFSGLLQELGGMEANRARQEDESEES